MKNLLLSTTTFIALSSTAQLQSHLNNGTATKTFYKVTNLNSQNEGLQIGINTGNTTGNDAFINLKENRDLTFSTNDAEKMRILNSGQIGIGTTTPSEILDVNGNGRFRNISQGTNDFITTHEANGTLHKIAFTGNSTDVLLGDGTFGTVSGSTDLDWDVQGNNMQAIPTGSIGVGVSPSSNIKFFTVDNNDAVQVAGAFRKLSSANQVGSAVGLQGISQNHGGFGTGIIGIASSNEENASSVGVEGISNGNNYASTGIRGNVSGIATNLAIGVQAISAANANVQYGTESTAGRANLPNTFNAGIRTTAYGNDVTANSTNYGVFATANFGKATSTNIGVFGRAQIPPSGVLATPTINYGISGYADNSGATNRAGYFNGDLEYTGTLISPSDAKLKNNIQELDANVLALISQLQPKSYEYKQDIKGLNLPQGEQYGFIAQELEKVLPQFVHQSVRPGIDKTENFKYKSVSYIGLIPVLTKAIQEQQKLIETQNKKIEKLESSVSKNDYESLKNEIEELKKLISEKNMEVSVHTINVWLDGEKNSTFLGQNQPNPFNDITNISYFIPESVKNARIEIYNIAGKLLKKEALTTGKGIVKVHASNLDGGTLTYSIITDGKVIETKKMILLK